MSSIAAKDAKNRTVAAVKDQVSCALDEDTVILHLGSGTYYGLNAVGSTIWNLIQEPRTIAEIHVELPTDIADSLLSFPGLRCRCCWQGRSGAPEGRSRGPASKLSLRGKRSQSPLACGPAASALPALAPRALLPAMSPPRSPAPRDRNHPSDSTFGIAAHWRTRRWRSPSSRADPARSEEPAVRLSPQPSGAARPACDAGSASPPRTAGTRACG